MDQYAIELILCRHWASYLNTPIFIVDPKGNLSYYNEPAELILGQRFSETGEMPMEEWSSVFNMTDKDGEPLAPGDYPLVIALHECRPVHMGLWMVGLDNVRRRIETTCFPLIGQADRFLGAVALFWEVGDK